MGRGNLHIRGFQGFHEFLVNLNGEGGLTLFNPDYLKEFFLNRAGVEISPFPDNIYGWSLVSIMKIQLKNQLKSQWKFPPALPSKPHGLKARNVETSKSLNPHFRFKNPKSVLAHFKIRINVNPSRKSFVIFHYIKMIFLWK